MNNYKLIIENIQFLEQFQLLFPNGDLKAYSLWLSDKMLQTKKNIQIEITQEFSKNKVTIKEEFPEMDIPTLITNVYRYSRAYIKATLENTVFNTVDEFDFLITLMKHESLLKSELILEHQMGISSGTEIIKRLINMSLIKEWPDPHDGRAKRVSLTIEGRNVTISIFPEIHKVAKIINGNLSLEEQKRMIISLNKLKNFHQKIYEKEKNEDLDSIIKKYLH